MLRLCLASEHSLVYTVFLTKKMPFSLPVAARTDSQFFE